MTIDHRSAPAAYRHLELTPSSHQGVPLNQDFFPLRRLLVARRVAAEARPPQHLELASDAPGHTPASLDTPVNSQVWGDIHAQYSLCQDDDPPTQPSVDGATSALEPPARLPTNQKAASANLGSLLEEGPLQTAETRAADEDVDPAVSATKSFFARVSFLVVFFFRFWKTKKSFRRRISSGILEQEAHPSIWF